MILGPSVNQVVPPDAAAEDGTPADTPAEPTAHRLRHRPNQAADAADDPLRSRDDREVRLASGDRRSANGRLARPASSRDFSRHAAIRMLGLIEWQSALRG